MLQAEGSDLQVPPEEHRKEQCCSSRLPLPSLGGDRGCARAEGGGSVHRSHGGPDPILPEAEPSPLLPCSLRIGTNGRNKEG